VRADDIPVAHTPPGGYGDEMPPLVLDGCDEPLPPGVGTCEAPGGWWTPNGDPITVVWRYGPRFTARLERIEAP
jgi:hypothetical protein